MSTTKITVNGIAYDSVDAMPPEVRRLYEEALAKLPELADRDEDGVPEIVEGELGPVKYTTTQRTRIVVNGKRYENVVSMPPEVRRAYEEAMRVAGTSKPTAKKNEINFSFQITGGRGFTFGKAWGGPRQTKGQRSGGVSDPIRGTPIPPSIEPGSAAGRLGWIVIILGACVAGGLMLLFLAGAR